MTQLSRWLIAWMLYGLGDSVSRLMNSAEILGHLYPVYNRLMGWSVIVQGPSANGPWEACPLADKKNAEANS
jgi:hypothetical protein